MRYILIIAAVLALAGTAQAAPPADKGAPPKLSIIPKRVEAGERFMLNARGFTPSTSVTIFFAITGEAPYASTAFVKLTEADGSWSVPMVFEQCRQVNTGGDVSVDLTLTLVDAFGVSASASLRLC